MKFKFWGLDNLPKESDYLPNFEPKLRKTIEDVIDCTLNEIHQFGDIDVAVDNIHEAEIDFVSSDGKTFTSIYLTLKGNAKILTLAGEYWSGIEFTYIITPDPTSTSDYIVEFYDAKEVPIKIAI